MDFTLPLDEPLTDMDGNQCDEVILNQDDLTKCFEHTFLEDYMTLATIIRDDLDYVRLASSNNLYVRLASDNLYVESGLDTVSKKELTEIIKNTEKDIEYLLSMEHLMEYYGIECPAMDDH